MRFTPLGKFLLFLVGLAIIATAVRLYVPKDKLPWPKKAERRATEERRRPDDTTESQVSRQPEKAREESSNRPVSNDPWAPPAQGFFRFTRSRAFVRQRRDLFVRQQRFARATRAGLRRPRGRRTRPR